MKRESTIFRAALVVVVTRRMIERLAVIIPKFADLRIHLTAIRDTQAALASSEIESELEFLVEDMKKLVQGGGL
jgi:hypothetical protein